MPIGMCYSYTGSKCTTKTAIFFYCLMIKCVSYGMNLIRTLLVPVKSVPEKRKYTAPLTHVRVPPVQAELKHPQTISASSSTLTEKHVMISYNHQHRQVASEIAHRLRQNHFKVWIDSDSMKSVDDLMDGMAMAVENAFLVLILFSKAYKDSPNTRSEAQYAYHMKKPLLFLRVQPAYRPDGWLGIMLGARIYLDFSGKYPFEKKFEELLLSVNKAANRESERVDKSITKATISTSTTSAIGTTSTKNTDEAPKSEEKSPDESKLTNTKSHDPPVYSTWNEEETAEWLKQSNAEWHGQESLTGSHLVFLSRLERESPEFFYDTLKNFGGLSNLTMLMNFTTALHRLSF